MTDNATAPITLGTLWEIPSKVEVKVTRPDGREVTVASDGKVAGHVLDVPGDYTAAVGDKSLTVTVG